MSRSTRIVVLPTPTETISTKPTNELERLYTEPETATTLRVSRLTLRKWRINGTGPRHTKMGKQVLYRASEIARYIEERTSRADESSGANEAEDVRK